MNRHKHGSDPSTSRIYIIYIYLDPLLGTTCGANGQFILPSQLLDAVLVRTMGYALTALPSRSGQQYRVVPGLLCIYSPIPLPFGAVRTPREAQYCD